MELSNALVRVERQPTPNELHGAYRSLRRSARPIRRAHGTLFGARAFSDLVVLATDYVVRESR
jgi:hypothetical protein